MARSQEAPSTPELAVRSQPGAAVEPIGDVVASGEPVLPAATAVEQDLSAVTESNAAPSIVTDGETPETPQTPAALPEAGFGDEELSHDMSTDLASVDAMVAGELPGEPVDAPASADTATHDEEPFAERADDPHTVQSLPPEHPIADVSDFAPWNASALDTSTLSRPDAGKSVRFADYLADDALTYGVRREDDEDAPDSFDAPISQAEELRAQGSFDLELGDQVESGRASLADDALEGPAANWQPDEDQLAFDAALGDATAEWKVPLSDDAHAADADTLASADLADIPALQLPESVAQQSVADAPEFDAAAFDAPAFDAPAFDALESDEPTFDAPPVGASAFDAPTFGTSAFDEPTFGTSAFDAPAFDVSIESKNGESSDVGNGDDAGLDVVASAGQSDDDVVRVDAMNREREGVAPVTPTAEAESAVDAEGFDGVAAPAFVIDDSAYAVDDVMVDHAMVDHAMVDDAVVDASAAPELLDAELQGFALRPGELVAEPSPIPGMEEMLAIAGVGDDAIEDLPSNKLSAGELSADELSASELSASELSTGGRSPVELSASDVASDDVVSANIATVDVESFEAPLSIVGSLAAGANVEATAPAPSPMAPAAPAESGAIAERDFDGGAHQPQLHDGTRTPSLLAPGERELNDFVQRSEREAHVLSTLEMVARRVRAGEIVPSVDAGASAEAVLASVLASILSSRT